MSLTKVSYSMISGTPVNVLDFGADPTGVADSTAAFILAVATGKPIYVGPGTYRIDSPIATDAAPVGNFYMEGASEAHVGFNNTGVGQCVINLSGNTQYFACIGYNSTIKNINFQNGVDVIHHTSQGSDGNTTKLIDIFANNFTGTFFKGVTPGNGSHLSWVRPVIVSNNTSSIVFDSVSMGGDGFDNLYITDGWIETSSTMGFKILGGRFSVNATRFIPYTNLGTPFWFQVTGNVHFYITDSDFGGESSRRILLWEYAGGDITFKNCGLFGTTANSYAITISSPPDFITLEDITSSSNPGKILFFDPNMSTTNLAKLAKTKFFLGNIQPGIETNLVNVDSLPGSVVVSQAFINQQPAFVQVSDLVGNGGYPYISTSYTPDFTVVNGITDILGGGTYGSSFTSTAANASGYQYYNTGPGISSLPDGYLTMEAIVSCNADCLVTFIFGSATQTFLVATGTHRICLPTIFNSTTIRQIAIAFIVPNVFTLNISQIAVFKNNYTSRNLEVMGSAAPTNVTFLWEKGNRVLNNNPVVGQPKSWVCTVSGAPGTWVSEGNL